MRPALGVGIALSTVAVAVSIGVVGVALHLLLDLDWRIAFLWGAVLSSTDAAAVFSVLRGVGVRRRLAGALELESGLNDAPVVIAVVLLASRRPAHLADPGARGLRAGWPAGSIGLVLGFGGAWALRRAALPATGLYPLATMAVCVLAYSAGQLVHASGLLATYVARAGAGQLEPAAPRRRRCSFAEGMGWLAQIGLFVLLGLYASPPRLVDAVVPAADRRARAAARRPAALGARGRRAVPGALAGAGVPVLGRAARGGADRAGADRARPRARRTGSCWSTSCSCWSSCSPCCRARRCPLVARLLRVARPAEPREIEVDAAPLDELGADLLQVRVPVGSRLRGVYLAELRLPRGRDGQPGGARRRGVHPGRRHPAAGARPAAGRHHRRRPGGRRDAGSAPSTGPVGWPAGGARPVRTDDGSVDQCECRMAPRGSALSHRRPGLGRRPSPRAGPAARRGRRAGAGRRRRHQGHRRWRSWRAGSRCGCSAERSTSCWSATPGAAFSLATGYTWLLTLIAIAVVVVIVRVARRLRSTGWAVALGLVLGGALGNLTDRIFRAPGPLRGHVVDIVSLFAPDGSVWPVFNVADSAIVCGGVLLVLLALLGRELDGTRTARPHRTADGG